MAIQGTNQYSDEEYAEMLERRLQMEEDFIEDVADLRNEDMQDQEIEDEQQNDRKKSRITDLFNFLKRIRRLDNDQEERENEEKAKKWQDIAKEGLKGAFAGFSVGSIVDKVLPEEQLDAISELREDYIRMYGDEEVYKKAKASMYKQIRELNKELGVAAFGGEDITEGLRQALLANVPADMADAFAISAAKLRKIGVDMGDSTAKSFSMGFKENADEIMDTLANVLSVSKINEEVKTAITEAVADAGVDIMSLTKTKEGREKSAANLAATLAQLESMNIVSVDQATEIKDLLLKVARGDSDALTTLGKLGVSSGLISKSVKSGDWGTAYQATLSGIARQQPHSEVIKAMGLDFDERQIAQMKNAQSDILTLADKSNAKVKESQVLVDGLSQAEIRARDISKTSWSERFKNWTGTTRLIETASDILEKFNIDAQTATSVIGGIAGVGKGLFDTFLMMKIAGFDVGGMLTKLMPIATSAGASLAGIGAAALPILGIVAAVAAVITAGVLLYKNWDKVSKWFGDMADWMKSKIAGMKDAVVGFVKELPGIGKVIDWFSDDEKNVELKEETGFAESILNGEVPESLKTSPSNINPDFKEPPSILPDLPEGTISSPVMPSINNPELIKLDNKNEKEKDKKVENQVVKPSDIKAGMNNTNQLLELMIRILSSIDRKTGNQNPKNLELV